MKTKIIFILLTVLFFVAGISTATSADENPLVKAIECKCKNRWPGDYEMQAYCIENQQKAAIQLVQFGKEATGEIKKILLRAYARWTKKDPVCGYDHNDDGPKYSTDWEMAVYEYKKQIEAYESLNRVKK